MFKFKSTSRNTLHALGIMTGTSLDGIDLALITTDGDTIDAFGAWENIPMPEAIQTRLLALMQGKGDALLIERDYTQLIGTAVRQFLSRHGINTGDVDVIGFHGQTITHRPEEGLTWQLGNPALLASITGLPVVADFRRADMAAGGEGAPLVPLYHAALATDLPLPVAVVNIGGVANVTWIGKDHILAFDTGPGNAPINDWVMRHAGQPYDTDGTLALKGHVSSEALDHFLAQPYFQQPPPKSLDRNGLSYPSMESMSVADGAATLTNMVAETIIQAEAYFPEPVTRWLVCGGGRHNQTIMGWLAEQLPHVDPVEAVGWRGDALEAEAFAFLAVRSLKGLPLTLPSTTGVTAPTPGGAFYSAPAADSP